MAKENVGKFYEELAKNAELQEKIKQAEENYDGDTADKDLAVNTIIIPLAKEHGFDFTAQELREYEKEQMQAHNLSEEELENVSGGGAGCFLIGFSSEGNACMTVGFATKKGFSKVIGGGLYSCVYFGLGFGGGAS